MWKNLSKSRLYVFSACAIIILAIILFIAVRWFRENYSRFEAAVERKEKKIALLTHIVGEAGAIEQEYARIKNSQAVTAGIPQALILKNLQDISEKSGLVITRLKPDEAGSAENGKGSDLRIEARAAMPALGHFLYQLPDINLPLTIKYLQLDTETRSEALKIQMLLNTISILDEREPTGNKTD